MRCYVIVNHLWNSRGIDNAHAVNPLNELILIVLSVPFCRPQARLESSMDEIIDQPCCHFIPVTNDCIATRKSPVAQNTFSY